MCAVQSSVGGISATNGLEESKSGVGRNVPSSYLLGSLPRRTERADTDGVGQGTVSDLSPDGLNGCRRYGGTGCGPGRHPEVLTSTDTLSLRRPRAAGELESPVPGEYETRICPRDKRTDLCPSTTTHGDGPLCGREGLGRQWGSRVTGSS